jgi:hypothetical protein
MLEKARERGLSAVRPTSRRCLSDALRRRYFVQVLAHVPDIKKAMQEMTRVTKRADI